MEKPGDHPCGSSSGQSGSIPGYNSAVKLAEDGCVSDGTTVQAIVK